MVEQQVAEQSQIKLLKRCYADAASEYRAWHEAQSQAAFHFENLEKFLSAAATLEGYGLVYDGPERAAVPSPTQMDAIRRAVHSYRSLNLTGRLTDFGKAAWQHMARGNQISASAGGRAENSAAADGKSVVGKAIGPPPPRETRSGGYSGHSKQGRGAYETAFDAFSFSPDRVFSLAELEIEMRRLGWSTKAKDVQASVRTTVKRLYDQGHVSRAGTGRYVRIGDPFEKPDDSEGGEDAINGEEAD